MLICCYNTGPAWKISDVASIANIIIAGVNICLAYYIFVYQRHKDANIKKEAAELHEQAIRLQWFKDLIIQPHLPEINKFYLELHNLEGRLHIKL